MKKKKTDDTGPTLFDLTPFEKKSGYRDYEIDNVGIDPYWDEPEPIDSGMNLDTTMPESMPESKLGAGEQNDSGIGIDTTMPESMPESKLGAGEENDSGITPAPTMPESKLGAGEQNDSGITWMECPNQTQWVEIEEYPVAGSARCPHLYFRLRWRERGRCRCRHITGGNTSKPEAIAKAARIREAIAKGVPVETLIKMC